MAEKKAMNKTQFFDQIGILMKRGLCTTTVHVLDKVELT